MRTSVATIGLMLTLGACATGVPRAIREPAPGNITIVQARDTGEHLIGRMVRWGGTIAGVDNRAAETWVEIVERPLDGSGQPRKTDRTGGRFLARVSGFLDPAIYAKGRDVTVSGTLLAPVARMIGEYPYTFPVVKTEQIHLWPQVSSSPVPRYYYDPFWPDPWYPWRYPSPYRPNY
ncbi:MAG: Slp family lipoprotein [Acidiferrobacterales bacterium]